MVSVADQRHRIRLGVEGHAHPIRTRGIVTDMQRVYFWFSRPAPGGPAGVTTR